MAAWLCAKQAQLKRKLEIFKAKEDLQIRLEEAQSRIVDLEQQVMSTLGGPNPWQQNTLRSAAATSSGGDEPDREYKVKLVEERDRLLDQKSELQDRIRGVVEENEVLKTTLDETQCELENLINEHERVGYGHCAIMCTRSQ